MKIVWIVSLGVLLLFFILLLFGYLVFDKVIAGSTRGIFYCADPFNEERMKKFGLAPYRQQMLAGRDWIAGAGAKDVWIKSFDGLRLYGKWIPAPHARGTLLAMHGYKSCADYDFCCACAFYNSLGLNLLLVDQRAHGKSEGKYIGFGILERYDAAKWVEWITQQMGAAHRIIVGGLSMGSSTVMYYSGMQVPKNVAGFICDCGYTSPWDVFARILKEKMHLPAFPFLYAVSFVCRCIAGYGFRDCSTQQSLRRCTKPVLFIHGQADTLVPFSMARQNYEACAGEKYLFSAKDAGHGTSFLFDPQGCQKALADFVDHVLQEDLN